MPKRRSLTEGLEQTPDELKSIERDFVFGDKDKHKTETPPVRSNESAGDVLPQYRTRAPVTTRVRPETATALKRASLTRQMNGQEPYHVQEIMEEALNAWLRDKGYIS